MIAPAPRNATIECLDAHRNPRDYHSDAFEALRAKDPGVDAVLIHALIAEVRRLSEAPLASAVPAGEGARVWKRVADLPRLYKTAANDVVTIPLTQEDVAHMAGTTRPTANQVLRSGEDKGVLRISRGRIEILDIAALTKTRSLTVHARTAGLSAGRQTRGTPSRRTLGHTTTRMGAREMVDGRARGMSGHQEPTRRVPVDLWAMLGEHPSQRHNEMLAERLRLLHDDAGQAPVSGSTARDPPCQTRSVVPVGCLAVSRGSSGVR